MAMSCNDSSGEEGQEEIILVEIMPDTFEVAGNYEPVRLTIDIKEVKGRIAAVYIIQEQDSILFENSFISEGIYRDTLDIEYASFIKKDHIIEVELQPNKSKSRIFRIEIVADGYAFNPIFIKQEVLEPPGGLDIIELESAEMVVGPNARLLKFDIQVQGSMKSIRKIQNRDTTIFQNTFVTEGVYYDTMEMDYATFTADGHFIYVDLFENTGNERTIEIELDALWTTFVPPYVTIVQKAIEKK